MTEDTYSCLIAFLEQHGAHYRLIDHAPEGRTEIVSPLRGNAPSQAAKCIVLMVKRRSFSMLRASTVRWC